MWLPNTQQDDDNAAEEVARDFHRGGALLGDHVRDCLNEAVANGYDIKSWPVDVIAGDLSECDAGCQGLSLYDLRPHIEAWLKDQTTET